MGLLLALSLFVALAVSLRLAAQHAKIRRLETSAITDPLTGAFNRRQMDTSLLIAIERRKRRAEPASLLLVDIDHFKDVNDAVGHPGGDRVLTAFARLVMDRLRKTDALFRIGGEEFALLLAGARLADALRVAESLRAHVASARWIDGRQVSISVGVSELRLGQSLHAWLEDADRALYRSKRGGRNRVSSAVALTIQHRKSSPGFALQK